MPTVPANPPKSFRTFCLTQRPRICPVSESPHLHSEAWISKLVKQHLLSIPHPWRFRVQSNVRALPHHTAIKSCRFPLVPPMRDCLYTVHKKGYPSQDEAWLLFILISSSFHSWDAHLLGKFLIITVVTSFQGGSWANFVSVSTHRATLALQSLLVMSLFFNALMPLAATFAEPAGYVETLKDLQHLSSSPGVRLAHFVTPCWDSAPGPPQYRKYMAFISPSSICSKEYSMCILKLAARFLEIWKFSYLVVTAKKMDWLSYFAQPGGAHMAGARPGNVQKPWLDTWKHLSWSSCRSPNHLPQNKVIVARHQVTLHPCLAEVARA